MIFTEDIFCRTENLIGNQALSRLKKARVAVFGVGGVGSAAVEALARAAVGHIALFDGDTVSPSNINRQLIATAESIGKKKVCVAAERIYSINPDAETEAHFVFYTPENSGDFDLSSYDYIIDAVDMVSAKIELALRAQSSKVPIISSMGTGNKLDPTRFEVCDIYKTSVCPLARVLRRELAKKGVKSLKVVYSKEPPISPLSQDKRTPASISFVPAAAGFILAGEAIKELALTKTEG